MNQTSELAATKAHFDVSDLYQKIIQWGVTLCGFGDVSCRLAKEFKHIPRAISLAIKHPSDGLVQKGQVRAYNNQFPEIDIKLKEIQQKIVTFLRVMGWRAIAIPPDTDQPDVSFISRLFPLFQHKTAATCSGLGWIGKNGLLVTEEYGARLSWATVLTDASLTVNPNPYLKGECGDCKRCVTVCPAGAIEDMEWVRSYEGKPKINLESCANQLTENYQEVGKYICGLCVIACPLGRRR